MLATIESLSAYFFSLIKMIFNKAVDVRRIPTLIELEHAVKRNFGGLEEFNTWDFFYEELRTVNYEVIFIIIILSAFYILD